jgi:subtilisin family serine protease
MNRIRPGHLVLTVRSGVGGRSVPAYLDLLAGAARPADRFDLPSVDRVLSRYGGGSRLSAVYHARQSLGRFGSHSANYDEVEEQLGISRTYKAQIARPERTHDVAEALRDLDIVESAGAQQLATIPFEALPATRIAAARPAQHDIAWTPHRRVHAPEAHDLEPGDERVTTAIVDTGVIVGHPELQRKCLAGYDTCDLGMGAVNEDLRLLGDSRGFDYNPHDEVGHGSHVAGIIGAQGWHIPPGVGGRSLLLPIRVLAAAVKKNANKRIGVGALDNINAGLKICIDLGADVINMSFGTPASSIDDKATLPHARMVKYATHYGCILVAAIGNSGMEEKFYPAAHPEVIAVGSVDAQGRRSRFSTWGEHIALCAPGENIVSSGLRQYVTNSGTSFAAPFVTGAIALLIARARQTGLRLTGPQVRTLLTESAEPLGGRFNKETGHGLLDVAAAIRLLDTRLAQPRQGGST